MVSRLTALAVLALVSVLPACAAETGGGETGDEADYTKSKGKLQLLVTVDWEGRDLTQWNLQAMQDLHAKFPDVKVVNFLNAAYYTKDAANADDVTKRIQSALGPNDEKGLHIHGWKRLFEASGVTFHNAPTFWGTSLNPAACTDDCGHEVPISEYSSDELRKVVKFSLDTLEAHGFGRPKSFRTGGWMAKPNVRDAVAAEGLTTEESAVPVQFLEPKLGTMPVYQWLGDLWKGIEPTSQPFTIETSSTPLLEVPDNGCLADYMSAAQMVDVYQQNKKAWLADRSKNVVLSIGFHEETASNYLPVLEDALTQIYADAKASKIPLVSVTSEAIGMSAPR